MCLFEIILWSPFYDAGGSIGCVDTYSSAKTHKTWKDHHHDRHAVKWVIRLCTESCTSWDGRGTWLMGYSPELLWKFGLLGTLTLLSSSKKITCHDVVFAHCRTSVPRDGGSLSGKTHSMDSMQHALIKNIDLVPSLEHVQLPLRRFCRSDSNSARVLSHAFGLTLAKGAAQVVPFVLIARRFGRGCSCKPCVRQCLEILLKGKEWKANERNGNQTKVPLTSMIHRVSTDGSLHQVDRSFCRREKGTRKVTLKAQKGQDV